MTGGFRRILRLLLVLGGVMLAGRLLLASPPVQHWLGNRIESAVGPGLRVGRVRLSFYPVLGIRLEEVHLLDPAQPDARSAIEAAEVRVAIALRPLLGADVEIEELIVSQLRIRIEPGPAGDMTLPGALSSLAEAEPQEPAPDPVEDATEETSDEPFRLPLAIRDLQVEVGRPPDEALVVTLRTLDATLAFGTGNDGIRFDIEARPGADGRIALKGTYGAGGVEDAVEFELSVEALSAADLLSEPLGGFATYSMSLSIRGTHGGGDVTPDLRGQGVIDFSGGNLASSNLARLIFDAFLTIMPKGDASNESAQTRKPAAIDHLRAELEIADGVVAIHDLEFVTDDFVVEGSGGVSFDLETLLDLEVALTTSGVARLLVSAKLPLPSKVGSLPPTPIRIKGEGGSFVARPQVERLPLAAAGYVVDAALGTGKGLLGRAGRLFKKNEPEPPPPRGGEARLEVGLGGDAATSEQPAAGP